MAKMAIEDHLDGPDASGSEHASEHADAQIDYINEIRSEYDLPPITREDLFEAEAEHMYESYGYDVDS